MRTKPCRRDLAALLASLLIGASAFAALQGCASSSTSKDAPGACTCKDCGRCLVCVCNADLACVKVEIDATTPSTTWNGKIYYFCSEQCMQAFLKDPAKYVKYDGTK